MRVFSVLAITALLLGVLAGAVLTQPAGEMSLDKVAASPAQTLLAARAKALIAPPAQDVTPTVVVDVDVEPAPQTEGGGQTTTTNNIFVNIPWWAWVLIAVLVIVVVALIASNRGGTTIIKD